MFCDNVPTRAEMNHGDGADQSEFQCEQCSALVCCMKPGRDVVHRLECWDKIMFNILFKRMSQVNHAAAAYEPCQPCTSRGDDVHLSVGQSNAHLSRR